MSAKGISTAQRDGFIATFELPSGELLTAHRRGLAPRSIMLRELCDDVTALHPGALLTGYSTPETIRADLRGRRGSGASQMIQYPEAQALAYARRRELLHPRFHARDRQAAERRRERRAA